MPTDTANTFVIEYRCGQPHEPGKSAENQNSSPSDHITQFAEGRNVFG